MLWCKAAQVSLVLNGNRYFFGSTNFESRLSNNKKLLRLVENSHSIVANAIEWAFADETWAIRHSCDDINGHPSIFEKRTHFFPLEVWVFVINNTIRSIKELLQKFPTQKLWRPGDFFHFIFFMGRHSIHKMSFAIDSTPSYFQVGLNKPASLYYSEW